MTVRSISLYQCLIAKEGFPKKSFKGSCKTSTFFFTFFFMVVVSFRCLVLFVFDAFFYYYYLSWLFFEKKTSFFFFFWLRCCCCLTFPSSLPSFTFYCFFFLILQSSFLPWSGGVGTMDYQILTDIRDLLKRWAWFGFPPTGSPLMVGQWSISTIARQLRPPLQWLLMSKGIRWIYIQKMRHQRPASLAWAHLCWSSPPLLNLWTSYWSFVCMMSYLSSQQTGFITLTSSPDDNQSKILTLSRTLLIPRTMRLDLEVVL